MGNVVGGVYFKGFFIGEGLLYFVCFGLLSRIVLCGVVVWW